MNAADALARLKAGNARFVEEAPEMAAFSDQARRQALLGGQKPFAIILGCADARVPAEIVFDQGIGDLFVVRVAGNVVAPSQLGSVEFAAEQFGTRLVVVLGHANCGAVKATLESLEQEGGDVSPNLQVIIDRIRPAVSGLPGGGSADEMLKRAIRANVAASVETLKRDSRILLRLIEEDGLMIVGAEYSLASGEVHFID